MARILYSVPEVHCSACERSIQNALSALPGVAGVAVDLEQKQVSVDYSDAETSPAEIRNRIERAGFDVGGG